MSRIHVTIDRIVVRGMDPAARAGLVEAIQSELARVLSDRVLRREGAVSHRTPVLRLGRMSLEPGPSGGRTLGIGMARALGRRLKP